MAKFTWRLRGAGRARPAPAGRPDPANVVYLVAIRRKEAA